MQTVQDFNEYGRFLNDQLLLRFSPIAFKMLWEGDEIPEGTVRPMETVGKRFAMCQAFGYVRRNRRGLTLLEDDNWCVWPVACFKFRELDEDDYETMGTKLFIKDREKGIRFFKERYPWLQLNGRKPKGYAMAPLESCTFVPDVVLIYGRVSQIMMLVKSAKFYTAEVWPNYTDTIASCAYSTIPMLNGQRFAVTLPDPGEYERALADEDEIIFSARGEEMGELVDSIKAISSIPFGYKDLKLDMNLEFPRAQFYDDMFRKWGLATGEIWKVGE